ncbi:protein TIC 20-v, chloroplastic [Cucurbita pepo subsp. pepo]|uniref:protein TIC 20-v, chloroplastic n=1 Tax=Cucurbita pepo subsp. pepo TaxID=3664 RepID=UPI000C9D6F38|nr:protein TIC 20-v, chloroplastic [Cucurbita pepo subsp. pepo]
MGEPPKSTRFNSISLGFKLSSMATLILNLSPKTLHSSFFPSPFPSLSNPRTTATTTLTNQINFTTLRRRRRRRILTVRSSGDRDNNTADGPDRLISAICYFYPFFDGVQYGKYVITQYAPFQVLIQPLVPAIRVFKSFPFNGFLVFLTLYFVVVRNPNFSRYVRFNIMQAIVLDVLLIFPDLLERSFNPRGGLGLDLVMSLDSTVFLFLLICLIYGSSSCLLGQVPRLPIVADAADRQVM